LKNENCKVKNANFEEMTYKKFDAYSAKKILGKGQGPKSSRPSFVKERRIDMPSAKRGFRQGGIGGCTIV
jgi:hypothetical protein